MKDFWKGIWTILKREIVAQFSSPMAYVFIVVFLIVSTVLYLFFPPFFAFPVADMSAYFGWIVPVLCVIAPAATMRIWAEDRKENTIELLLTFPISAPALVLGKFLAAFAFYVSALTCTWVIPLMLAWLGEPDWGPIFSGYFGAMLLGALFLALGMFISGFCRDQVTAFVLSFLACGVISLAGWRPFVTIMEGTLGGFGSFVGSVFGMTGHYDPFRRGIVEVSDIFFFLAWTALFLFLNGVYLEGRSRPKAAARFQLTVAMAVVVGALVNVAVTGMSLIRFDLTEGNIYSVSDSTKSILGRLKVPVQANVYISPAGKMPAQLKSLERDIMAKLDEMRIASGGMLRPSVKHMLAAKIFAEPEKEEEGEQDEKQKRKKSLEERLIEKGVRPFSVSAFEKDATTTQLIYSSIGVAYKEKEEEIIPRILPDGFQGGNVSQLEYLLMNVIFKITREKEPTVALVAPYEDVKIPPYIRQMMMRQGRMPPQRDDPYEYLQRVLQHEKFKVQRVKLERGDGLPDEYDTLAIVNPRELDDRQRWEIARALRSGKSVFLAVQQHKWNYAIQRRNVSMDKRDENPKVNELLAEYGLEVDPDILMDASHQALTIRRSGNPLEMFFGGGITLNLPIHISVKSDSMNPNLSITSRLSDLFYLWGSALKLDNDKLAENKLEVSELLATSDSAWTIPSGSELKSSDFEEPADTRRMPLAVFVQGQFPDVYAGRERPEWADKPPQPGMPPPRNDEPEGPGEPVEPAPGKLVLVGCSEMFSKNFVGAPGHLDLFMNSIEALTFGDELIHIRSKKRSLRTFAKPSDFARTFWKIVTLFSMSAVVVAGGIAGWVLIGRRRARYRASLSKAA